MAPRKRRGRTSGAQVAASGSVSNSIASSPSSNPFSKSDNDNDSQDRANPSRTKTPDLAQSQHPRLSPSPDRSILPNPNLERTEDDPKVQKVLKAFEDANLTIDQSGGQESNFTVAGVVLELYKQMIDWAVTDIAVQFKHQVFLAAEVKRQNDIISGGDVTTADALTSERRPPVKEVAGSYGSRLLYSEKNVTAECSNCGSNISASRYAQHLEKCLGRGGRQSSRAASARLRASAERAEKEAAADMEDVPPRRRRMGSSAHSDSEIMGYGGLGSSKRRKMSPVPSGGSQGAFHGRAGLPPSGRTRASPQ